MVQNYSFAFRSLASGMKTLVLSAGIILAMAGMTSCHDDPETPSLDSSIEETETGKISTFSVNQAHFSLPDVTTDLSVALIGEDDKVYTYDASAVRNGEMVRFSIVIPEDDNIPDGTYTMTFTNLNGTSVAGRLRAEFKDGRLASAAPIAANYPLKGSGSTNDPYLIASEADFGSFCQAVNKDASHGAGLVFSQTSNLNLTLSNPGSGYFCDTFAGIYNGEGNSISMEITSDLSGGGLFGTLIGTPTVGFIVFSNATISNGKDYCGIVAGKVTGDAILETIRLTGAISGHDNVGGLIGYATGGNITISDVSSAVSVVGQGGYVGGIVGMIDSPKSVTIKNCTVSSPVVGSNYVGGAFGNVDLSSSTTEFRVDGLKVAYSLGQAGVKGNNRVGGMAGAWSWVTNKKMSVSKPIDVSVFVEGTQSEVGGIFGKVENTLIDADDFSVGESDKTSRMTVRGISEVGGLIGNLSNTTLKGSQYFDLMPAGANSASVPAANKFSSSFSGMVKGLKNVGGLVGTATSSNIHHLSSAAVVEEGGENIGGIVGYFSTSSDADALEDCTFTGEINASSAENVGGVAGYYITTSSGLIKDCVNYGSIVGGYYTGGIVGYVFKKHNYSDGATNMLDISWAVNVAKVEGSYNVGGIIGRIYSEDTKLGGEYINENEVTVSDCMNAAEVIARGGNSEEALGGIVGRTGALTLVTLSANHGALEGRGKLHAIGGIVGRMGQDPTLGESPCYNSFATEDINTGSINATETTARIGGIAGYGEEGGLGLGQVYLCGITNCRNSGEILPDQHDDTGGILGFADNWIRIASNFNTGKVMHGNALLGTQKTNGHQYWGYNYTIGGCGGSWPLDNTFIVSASHVTDESVYTDFDFDTIWEMTSDGPNLRRNRWRDPASAKIN